MAAQVNTTKQFWKRDTNTDPSEAIQKNCRKNTMKPASSHPEPKPDKDVAEKVTIGQYSDEHKCRSPQQNTCTSTPTTLNGPHRDQAV